MESTLKSWLIDISWTITPMNRDTTTEYSGNTFNYKYNYVLNIDQK